MLLVHSAWTSGESTDYLPGQGPHDAPTPHEDGERKPDGVPHEVIGQTAFTAVMVAALVAVFLLFVGGVFGVIAAVLLLLVGTPLFVSRLSRRAQFGRVAHGPHG